MADRQIPKIDIEYVFSIRIFFKERVTFMGPRGGRGYVPPASGEIWGPRLQGKVVPYSGADYAMFKDLRQGIQVNTHYMLQANDGAWIYIHNIGYLHHDENDPSPQPYFRMTPYFDAPTGPHDWLTRTVILGTGERRGNPDHSLFTYYAVK
ncbi:MAG TPA: DUF3237 domain-containing protein [Alphaproteobacteria bacterium]|nr:DUF3237 domain-containing protein [Alphaproteobacteria bacterium]